MFFFRARDLTGITDTSLEVSPSTTAHGCLNRLISNFSCLEEIRNGAHSKRGICPRTCRS
ncbi:molybdopterin synthase sulfur carrier subunit [Phtheirospermum japonicum]|uniref:Molybdopterin synthase sulfur carrier subunit n=1 Tax=Phtheirospermum japonicum TaxID=374723 RepID=A0A830BRL5_9LAMI|nr:molybdopterin synthase sulfur carrier subunit [Phtheirospermum japonicum]